MSERNLRKTRVGIVASDKMDKTVVVAIQDNVKHPLYKKIIKNVLYDLKTKYKKTIIVWSRDSNIIYSLCDISLLVNRDNHLYGITKSIFNEENLKGFNILVPDLVRFTDLVKKKGVNIGYFQDIRDLIKDVYRNV